MTNPIEVDQLAAELKGLKQQNHKKRNVFHSLKLVLSELKNENGRLKMEERERTLRLEQMKKAKESLKQTRQFNSNLLKFMLEQRAACSTDQKQDEIEREIKNHESIQNDMKEKVLSLNAKHENMPSVKKYNELRHEETLISANIEEVKISIQNAEKVAQKTLNNLDKKINGKILAVVVKAKLLADVESGKLDKDLSLLSTFNSEIDNTPEMEKPPLVIEKLSDITFPEMPAGQYLERKQSKANIQITLQNLKEDIQRSSKKFSLESNGHHPKIVSKTEKTKNIKSCITAESHEFKQTNSSRANYADPINKTAEGTKLYISTKSEASPLENQKIQVANTTNQMIRTSPETFENMSKEESSVEKSGHIRTITIKGMKSAPQSNLRNYSNKSEKIVILSDITIKNAAAGSENAKDLSENANKFSVNVDRENASNAMDQIAPKTQTRQIEYSEKLKSETNLLTNQIIGDGIGLVPPLNPTTIKKPGCSLQKNDCKTATTLKRKINPEEKDVTLKLSPLKNLKGIRIQTFQNTPIDLNSDLPSSHITINSSYNSTENIEKTSKPASPTISPRSLEGFLNDFNFDVTSPEKNDRKRKLSSASSFGGGLDFGSFDLNKKPKKGSDEGFDDFPKILSTSSDGGKDVNNDRDFDFDAFIGSLK